MKEKKIGSKKNSKKLVSSIIEITKPEVKVDARSLSLQAYHTDVKEMGKKVEKFALSLSDNLLSVKMALMQGVQSVEKKIQENREK
jgi:hypothetical protein